MTHEEIQAKAESQLRKAEGLASDDLTAGAFDRTAGVFDRHVRLAGEWMSLLSILQTPSWMEPSLAAEA